MEKTLSEYISIAKNIDKLKLEKKLKISILSSFTLNGLEETLHVMCSELGIKSQSYVSGYNQYNQELLNPESNFYNFSPDIKLKRFFLAFTPNSQNNISVHRSSH